MSTYQEYDPTLFALERAEIVSARLGEFVIGLSKLGAGSGAWVPVEAATFSYSSGYTPDEFGTLIIDSETATVSMSYWDSLDDPLYPSDRVRASYGDKVLFLGTVDTTRIEYVVDPDARSHGATRKVLLSATLAGTYATALSKTVCWKSLPTEYAITRIRRWVTVTDWGGPYGDG